LCKKAFINAVSKENRIFILGALVDGEVLGTAVLMVNDSSSVRVKAAFWPSWPEGSKSGSKSIRISKNTNTIAVHDEQLAEAL